MKKILPLLAVIVISAAMVFAACGENKPVHTHEFGAWITDSEPTCIEYGQQSRKCACGEKETMAIAPTFEHDFDEGECYICGSHEGSEGLTYAYNESADAYELTAVPASLASVTVSNVYDDGEHGAKFVLGIGAGAFKAASPAFNTALTSVYINEKTESISGGAFYNCTSLGEIHIPESLGKIGANAFYNCRSLQSIELPALVSEIEAGTFYGCASLGEIDFPSVKTVGSSAFVNCTSLQSANLENALTLGSSAFYGCVFLSSVDISEVTAILPYTFYNCVSLTSDSIIMPKVTEIADTAFGD